MSSFLRLLLRQKIMSSSDYIQLLQGRNQMSYYLLEITFFYIEGYLVEDPFKRQMEVILFFPCPSALESETKD